MNNYEDKPMQRSSLEYEPFEPNHHYMKKTFTVKKHSDTYLNKRKKGIPTEFDRFGKVFLKDFADKKTKLRTSSMNQLAEKSIVKRSAMMKRNNSAVNMGKRPPFAKYNWDVDSMEMTDKCIMGVRDCRHFHELYYVDVGRKGLKKKPAKRASKPKPPKPVKVAPPAPAAASIK